mgnify:FL=1
MHKYLRGAGFTKLSEAAVYSLIWKQVVVPENLSARLDIDEETVLFEYRMAVNENIGICAAVLCIGDHRELQYYYPYYSTYEISSNSVCTLERHTAGNTYSGVLDEYNIGLSLIFFVTNPVIYRQRPDADKGVEFKGTALAAFANSGIVILPVMKAENIAQDSLEGSKRDSLIEAAMGGDEDAIETLTASDIDMYNQISDRIGHEDLYSVVEQSFMPCGVECDRYSVIGEILEVEENVNGLTEEKLWLLKLSCNDVEFWLCMRQADLMGEPMKGRRVKCRLWMQGSVNMHV